MKLKLPMIQFLCPCWSHVVQIIYLTINPGRNLVPSGGGAYLAGEELLLYTVLHGWRTGSYQAPLGFLQPQLKLVNSPQAAMKQTFTGAGPRLGSGLLQSLGRRQNTPGWASLLQCHRYEETEKIWIQLCIESTWTGCSSITDLSKHMSGSSTPTLFPLLSDSLLFLSPLCSTHLWPNHFLEQCLAPVTATLYHWKNKSDSERKEASGYRGGAETEGRLSWAVTKHFPTSSLNC